MFRILLLLFAVAGLHARPLHRFPNGKLKQIGPQMVQDEHRDSSVLKHVNNDVKPPVPAEFCRQGTEPSRRFLMDLNTGMLKRGAGETNRKASGLDEFKQGTEKQLHTQQELRMRPMMRSQYSAQSEKHEQRAIPAEVYRKGTEPSRNVLVDLNTGLLKEHMNKLDRRVVGSAKLEVVSEHEDIRSQDSSELKENHKAVPVESRRQGTEPSRRILIDPSTGMPKEELTEMNRRVSGFYNPSPIGKRQGTEPSRRFLMDMDSGMLKHVVGEMNRRVSGFYNPPPYEMRKGTQNSRTTLVDPRTGQLLASLTELQRSTSPLDEFRQGTEYQPYVLQELRVCTLQKQCSEPSRNLLMDMNAGLLKTHRNGMDRRVGGSKWEVVSEHEDIRSQDSSENHKAVPVESRRQGTEPSRRILIDPSTGMPKEELTEMNRRVSGFYNPAPIGKRQGTEPSRRFLMDMDSGMLKHVVGEMNRRVSGFYNPPPYEMRKGTQNSHATLVDPRTGQLLASLKELQRSTSPLDEFRQGTEYHPYILQELRVCTLQKQCSEPSRNLLMDMNAGLLKTHRNGMDRRVGGSAKWEVVSEHEDIRSQDSSENHKAVPVESRRQGTEPSRRILIDPSTGMPKEELTEMNRRVSGFYNPAPIGKRQGTEPSRRFLMDMDSGMLKHVVGEMNRRVSGFYNPPPYEMRKGTQNSRTTLVDPRTGQLLASLKELQRSTSPLDEFRQGTEYHPYILQELRVCMLQKQCNEPSRNLMMDMNAGLLKEHKNEMDSSEHKENHKAVPVEIRRQGTEPSRRFLMDMDSGMLKHEVGEMNRRVSGFYNPPPYEMRKGTQNSHATLVDPRTGLVLPSLKELQRSTAPLDEFRQGTEYQPYTLLKLKMMHHIVKPKYRA
ncbi:uncharacterized protein wu:fa56d06 isoform X10 [Carassius gibelio]|uniref:uncharacterized protein wu:fa56d06 isoform X10 n=1 Tax=Carassius gibelio TaxID=101364 RepID=UPI0022788553|nr:uncharacterized protein wu:fa56d06 isoform X10 [Carassius gibelio]